VCVRDVVRDIVRDVGRDVGRDVRDIVRDIRYKNDLVKMISSRNNDLTNNSI
jgi:hypothetical protein